MHKSSHAVPNELLQIVPLAIGYFGGGNPALIV
jgi:hypothetical protein